MAHTALAALDASFVHLETAAMPMHVGALHILELPAGFQGRYLQTLRAHLAARLPQLPVLRRRLAPVAGDLLNPAWVEARPDLRVHVRAQRLPPGSGIAALEAAVGRLHGQRLDRRRPLWRFHVFEDLAPAPDDGARRVAVYTQLHHAAVDGQAAVALAQVLLEAAPGGPVPVPARQTRPAPARTPAASLWRAALLHEGQVLLNGARALPASLTLLGRLAADLAGDTGAGLLARLRGRRRSGAGRSPLRLAPRTPFNRTISARRVFASVSLPLAELQQLRRRHGASLNELLLFLCASALRRYLLAHQALPRRALVAAVPVSLRGAGDGRANTQATLSTVLLPSHIAAPAQRLAAQLAGSRAMKTSLGTLKALMPLDFPSLGLPWLMAALARAYGALHAAETLPVLANLVISNVPGPPQALYLAGARMLSSYPASICVHGLALNITVQSYGDALDFGLVACGEAVPDIAQLAGFVRLALDELRAIPAAAR